MTTESACRLDSETAPQMLEPYFRTFDCVAVVPVGALLSGSVCRCFDCDVMALSLPELAKHTYSCTILREKYKYVLRPFVDLSLV